MGTHSFIRTAGFVVPCFIIACGADSSGLESSKISDLTRELADAKQSLKRLSDELAGLQGQLDGFQNRYRSAVLDPSEKGYSRLDTSVGSFAVTLENVQAYTDGVRIQINVGNLGTATVNGGTFHTKWGLRMPEPSGSGFIEKYNEWVKSLREKSVDFSNNLSAGTWNRVVIDLPGTPPAQFGYLELSMVASRISLLQQR